MSCRVDTAPLIASSCVVSLYAGHGVRGDAVPSTGTHGPSPVYNDLVLPADAAKEYRWAITAPPASGTLTVYEDCSYSYAPPGGTTDLTVTYTYRLWQDGLDMGTAVETIVIGAGSIVIPPPAVSVISRPTSDVLSTGWTATPSGSLYSAVDEEVESDADYVSRSVLGAEPVSFGITPILTAGPQIVRVRAASSGSMQIRAVLQNAAGTTVGTSAWRSVSSTPTTYALTATTTEDAHRVQIEALP